MTTLAVRGDGRLVALALGAAVAQTRRQQVVITAHQLPDLTDQEPGAILAALLEALAAAHPDDLQAAANGELIGQCPACTATIDVAFHAADSTNTAPVNPVQRLLSIEFAWLDEIKRWEHLEGVTFARAAWDEDRAIQEREHFFRTRYRDQIPPWVLPREQPS